MRSQSWSPTHFKGPIDFITSNRDKSILTHFVLAKVKEQLKKSDRYYIPKIESFGQTVRLLSHSLAIRRQNVSYFLFKKKKGQQPRC